MSRVWVILVAVVISASGGAVVYEGVVTGGWVWGALYGLAIPAIALYEWLTLRKASAEAKTAADRLALVVMFIMVGLARDGFNLLEADVVADERVEQRTP